MGWFIKEKKTIGQNGEKKVRVPEGLWTKCRNCRATIYSKEIGKNLNVCPKCDYHFRISARTRLNMVLDEGSFTEIDKDLESTDFLDFKDSLSYQDRIRASMEKGVGKEAVV